MASECVNPEIKKHKTTAEIIHPLNLPEVAFQSYKSLITNVNEQKEAFLSGEFRNSEQAATVVKYCVTGGIIQ